MNFSIFLYAVTIFVTLSSTEPAVVIINLPNFLDSVRDLNLRPLHTKVLKPSSINRSEKRLHALDNTASGIDAIDYLLNALNKDLIKSKHDQRINCKKVFGSMYGSKLEKEYCSQNKLTETSRSYDDIAKYWPFNNKYPIKQPIGESSEEYDTDFVDLTRANNGGKNNKDVKNPKKFVHGYSYDYVDFSNLRRNSNNHVFGGRRFSDWEQSTSDAESDSSVEVKPKKKKKNYGKGNTDDVKSKKKHKNYGKDTSENVKPKRNSGKSVRKPKRFNIIENKSDSDGEPTETVSEQKPSFSLSSDDDFEPMRKEKHQDGGKSYALQGNRLIYLDSRGSRRRLPYFLPKRNLWRHEDIQDLGYLWFNGPKGLDYRSTSV